MSEMTLVKQWHVSYFDENDIEYVKGLDCEFEVHNKINVVEVNAPNGRVYQYADRQKEYGLYITTRDKKQEAMLMLKYEGSITLLRMFYIDEWTRYELQPDI